MYNSKTETMARHGENIRKRKDGRWEARYIHSYDENGKAKYRSVYGNTYDEVKEKRAKAATSTDYDNTSYNHDITFAQVAEKWLETKKDVIKVSSYNHYLNQLESHIIPDLVNCRFSSLTSAEINALLKNKINQGYSPTSVSGLRTILMMIFHYARKNRIVCNVSDPVFIPQKKKSDIEAFTLAEQSHLDEYLQEHPDQFNLAIYLSLYCGLRIGEICALQWQDIIFTKEIIIIDKTLIRIQKKNTSGRAKTEVVIQKPKTESSNRTIPIPSFLIPVLKKYCGKEEEYVITGSEHFMEPRVCLRRFKNIISKIEIADYTFHACRHTFATRCVEIGIDAKTLSELLGHASVKTTLDRYVHPSIDLKKEQMNKLGRLTRQGR